MKDNEMTDLNKRERAILKFIDKQIREKGYPPSVREIGEAVDLSSTATVHSYLAKLSKKGYIKKDGSKNRALELLVENEFAIKNNDLVVSTYEKYNNAIDMFNTAFTSYQNHYNRTHKPKGQKFKYF